MESLNQYRFRLLTGSVDLYGNESLAEVDRHAREIAESLSRLLPWPVMGKPVLTSKSGILSAVREANADPLCAGVLFWMHTFSPAQLWIEGLLELRRPACHLHTQYNRDLPWAGIDMDFMNLNQSAHGDREFGHLATRLGMRRKVVVGHWRDPLVHRRLTGWMRAAVALSDGRQLRVARLGDNMRSVAVTEGDKVEAHRVFGWSTEGYGVGELAELVAGVPAAEAEALLEVYRDSYEIDESVLAEKTWTRVREQARIECALRAFLEQRGALAFTTTFEDLHGLPQLPGLAVQRLMADGWGFAAEGDWKTAALLRAAKVMATGLPGGASFMEDYTYHLDPRGELVLGAHMLELCPSVARDRPRLMVHPLAIGSKGDPARLVFEGAPGRGLNASLVDLGPRFRLIVNEVEAVAAPAEMPRLPVARVLWKPMPDIACAAEAWIHAGGAHHVVYSGCIETEWFLDWAEMAGVEVALIDTSTSVRRLMMELRWGEAYYGEAPRR